MDNPSAVGPVPIEPCSPKALALAGVSARYPAAEAEALSGVTLHADAGDVIALIGPNGAGKSTLLRVCSGLVPPAAGAVKVLGDDVRGLSRRSLARRVAFVAQHEAVPEGFTVREVVAMGRAPHQGPWMRTRREDEEVIEEAMLIFGLAQLADRVAGTLSGGEQRRAALARALAQRPRVLLLDEPAAFLDVRHKLELHESLRTVAGNLRIACLVAMHDLDAAARFATRVVAMRGGRIAAAGSPDDVMTPAVLESVFGARLGVGVHAPTGSRYFVAIGSANVKGPEQ